MGKQYAIGKKRRVRIDDALIEYDDATQVVRIPRTLMDVWRGVPGKAGECMNAQCIVRNKKAFPHKVLAASVQKSRVFILDKVDHAWRYVLSYRDSKLIQTHDEEALGQPGELVLRPPSGHDRAGTRREAGTQPGNRTGTRKKGLARGEKARIEAAVGAMH